MLLYSIALPYRETIFIIFIQFYSIVLLNDFFQR